MERSFKDGYLMVIPVLILIALFLESRPEATVYSGGYHGYGPRLFGFFRWNYHVPMFFRWMLTCIAVTVVCEGISDTMTMLRGASFFFGYASVQDIGFWMWKGEWPAEESWVGRMFGGFCVLGRFIPHAWWMGFVATYGCLWVIK